MNSLTDRQLLREYAEKRSETAFGELVRRHVDLVYSAAVRMVCDSHLAQDVAQGVFLALARSANGLEDRIVLSGWLYRTTQNIAAQTVRTEVRRHAREREAAAMNEPSESNAAWERIALQLETAVGELSESEREAVLLRYFERQSAKEMAQTLGTSEVAAQKRVSRAVERLRELFAARGVAIGSGGLAIAISANAVHAAPAGLTAAILTTATAATAGAAGAATTAAKTIAMTSYQKFLVTAVIVAATGTGIYQARQASELRLQNEKLRQLQTPVMERIQKLEHERGEMAARMAALADAIQTEKGNAAEKRKLKEDIARFRKDSNALARVNSEDVKPADDPADTEMRAWVGRVKKLKQRLDENPNLTIPEFSLFTEQDWLNAARLYTKRVQFDAETDFLITAAEARQSAQIAFAELAKKALKDYARANNGGFPNDPMELKSCFKPPIEDAILERYTIVPASTFGRNDKGQDRVLTQKNLVDEERDHPIWIGPVVFGYYMKP